MTKTRRTPLLVLSAVAALGVLAPPAMAKGRSEPVNDSWVEIVPCAPTAVDSDPNHLVCVGSSAWAGTWSGVTEYAVDGEIDLVTGAGSGTIDETFVGTDSNGRAGTLRLTETFVTTPTGVPGLATITIAMDIVSGTGDFVRSRGHAVAVGTVSLGGGGGTFDGTWSPPRR